MTSRGPFPRAPLVAANLLAPLLAGLSVIALVSRGPTAPSLAVVALAGFFVVGAAIAAVHRLRRRAWFVALPILALAAFLTTYRAAPLPRPAPFAGPLPPAHPPPTMALYALPTGITHRTAAFAVRGGSPLEARDFVMTAVLVTHPRGDVLVDTGLGRDIATQLATMPPWFRAMTRFERTRSAAEQLDDAHYDRHRLAAVVLTHAHWDHASGLPELAGTPVWVPSAERRFIEEGGAIMGLTRSFHGVAYVSYDFDGGPYLGFERSHDVYGDGSIVLVPAPGHTPGSVVVFLALPDGRRWALLGDLVWQLEGVTERAPRAWLNSLLGDDDPAAARTSLARIAAVAEAFPSMAMVPAHDRRGFSGMGTVSTIQHSPRQPPP